MDLQAFGQTLSGLMKQARVTRPTLAHHMNVSVALVDKWKSTSANKARHRQPSYRQFIELAAYFAPQLNPQAAQQWAHEAGHQLQAADLTAIFPPVLLQPPPAPEISVTYSRLEPLPTHRLFGIKTAKAKMLRALQHPHDYWLLAIDGIGGIGKTALANILIREMLEVGYFYDVVWLSARRESFLPDKGLLPIDRPALTPDRLVDSLLEQLDSARAAGPSPREKEGLLAHWFKHHPFLVVIDNLETIQDYEALLEPLRRWANPTKFLLTSRRTLSHHTDVYSHTLTELSRADTLAFLKYQGDMQNIFSLAQAADDELIQIYKVVGGNPLALKLVVGQIRFTGLPEVLAALKKAQGKTVDGLYRYIYRQIWETLPEPTRRVLTIMPLAQNGTRRDLERLSDINGEALAQALHQLISRSLVESGGTLDEPRYGVHSLTKTFLHTEIFDRWKPA